MIGWKRKWKSEIDSTISRFEGESARAKERPTFILKRRFISALACCFALIVAVYACFTLIKPAPTDSSVVLLEINPSIAFVVDDEGKVSSYSATNADADVVLASGLKLKGKTLTKSVELFVHKSCELGFADFNSDVIRLSSTADVTKCKNKLEDLFVKENINVYIDTQKLNAKDFAELVGVNGENTKQIINNVKKLPEKFFDEHKNLLSSITVIREQIDDMLFYVTMYMPEKAGRISELVEYFASFNPEDFTLETLMEKIEVTLEELNGYRAEKNGKDYHNRPEVSKDDYDNGKKDPPKFEKK